MSKYEHGFDYSDFEDDDDYEEYFYEGNSNPESNQQSNPNSQTNHVENFNNNSFERDYTVNLIQLFVELNPPEPLRVGNNIYFLMLRPSYDQVGTFIFDLIYPQYGEIMASKITGMILSSCDRDVERIFKLIVYEKEILKDLIIRSHELLFNSIRGGTRN